MFDALTDRLSSVFDRLSGRGVLSEKDVAEVMREIRVALLEADVALPVVRDFIAKATEAATGEAVIRSVRPADQVVKITYDGLVEMLGGEGYFMDQFFIIICQRIKYFTTGQTGIREKITLEGPQDIFFNIYPV